MGRLRALYDEGETGTKTEREVLARRREIFAEFGASEEINNAVLLAHYAYSSHLEGFQCVLEEEGGDVGRALARVRAESEASPESPFVALGACAPEPLA